LTSVTKFADAFTEVECWHAAVGALWLDVSLERGFAVDSQDSGNPTL